MKLDLEFRDTMPEHVTPLEAVAMVKCLDEDGQVTWFKMATEDLNLMESLGMLRAAVVVVEATVSVGFIEDDRGEGGSDNDE